jgi:4-hydroxy-3-polyprenylbenzoate decarboxylase
VILELTGDIMKANNKKRLVVGMSGASGAVLGIEVLKVLRENPQWETHLVISKGAELTIAEETEYTLGEVKSLADKVYDIKNIGESIASGTFRTEGMIIVPCSMKTVAGIASGYSDNLLLRAADVTIKERRNLVIVARESPLSTIHLRNLLVLAQSGAIIIPPMVTYYNKPLSLEDMNRQIVGKILDKFGIEVTGFNRWGENIEAKKKNLLR